MRQPCGLLPSGVYPWTYAYFPTGSCLYTIEKCLNAPGQADAKIKTTGPTRALNTSLTPLAKRVRLPTGVAGEGLEVNVTEA